MDQEAIDTAVAKAIREWEKDPSDDFTTVVTPKGSEPLSVRITHRETFPLGSVSYNVFVQPQGQDSNSPNPEFHKSKFAVTQGQVYSL